MTGTRPAEILRHLEQSGSPDGALLARFVASRDGAAFEELVRRHGPLVLGVCRRVTGHPQDAEEAFQATFLVLAQKAGPLRNAAQVGNWLYGVAFRVSRRVKRAALRRKAREVLVSALPEPPAPSVPLGMSELGPILDAELAALPARLREAIVLCDLLGTSREAAATALGIPEGTLPSRLASGRKKLAERLTRRGVALSAAALPLALAEVRAASVSNELVTKTCGLVADWAAGGTVPGPLIRFAEGGFAVRKVLAIGALMAVGVAGMVFAAHPREDPPVDPFKRPVVAEKTAPAQEVKEEPKAAEKTAITFRTTPRMVRSFDSNLTNPNIVRWNATGTHFALLGSEATRRPEVGPGGERLVTYVLAVRLYSLNGKELSHPVNPNNVAALVAVLPDGSGIVTDLREYQLISGHHQLKFWTIKTPPNIELARTIDLELPETHGYTFSANMKTFRTVAWERGTSGGVEKLEVMEVDAETGSARKSLLKLDYGLYALSANGKRIAVLDKDVTKVTVYDLDRGAKVSEAALPGEKLAQLPRVETQWNSGQDTSQNDPTLVLSPDGKRLVVSRAIGQTIVLNTDTGESLPPLEGIKDARVQLFDYSFTGDGRLLAMPGVTYISEKRATFSLWVRKAEFLTVWDTQTGKALKTWNRLSQVAFNPVRPLLAIFEPNGEDKTRVGFWDFSAEAEKK